LRNITVPETDSLDARLNRWLNQRGLQKNPFDIWNAERDPDLPGYFVDVGQFDELLRLTEPCIVFARRGCGKTAQRQMLAAQCRPLKLDSSRLAVIYTYAGFEQALVAAGNDVSQIRATHHVAALLRQGLMALEDEAERDPKVKMALARPHVDSRLAAYLVRYAPHLVTGSAVRVTSSLDGFSTWELVQGFVDLVKAAGLSRSVVLVDGLDEFLLTAGDSAQLVTLLAPLLGTLPLIEFPGLAFKFFLPQEIEPALRDCRWFRPDRLRIFRIAWKEGDLQNLIGQRLTYFSKTGDRACSRLGQLCQDELADRIDRELADLAGESPRAALTLADMLLRAHCEQSDPPERIAPVTWKVVEARWQVLHADLLAAQPAVPSPEQAPGTEKQQPGLEAAPPPSEWPALVLDETTGCVWLGEREITKEIRAQDFRVLACLYRNRNAVCSKDLLVEQAWPDAKGAVSDQAIAASIARLRRNLGQSSPYKGYIETVIGRGYRLHPEGFVLG
jgi:hypothetical protein